VLEKDALLDPRARSQVAAVADPGGADDRNTGFDAHVGADVHGAHDLHAFPVDRGVEPQADAVLELLAGHVHLGHLAAQHALQHGPVVRETPDVDPVEEARLRVERQFLLDQQRKQLAADIEDLAGRDQVDDLGLEEVDTGARQRGFGLFGRRLFLEGADPPLLVGDDNAVVADLITRHLERHDAGHGLLHEVFVERGADVEIDDRVAADHQRGLVEESPEILDLAHATGGAERLRNDLAVVAYPLVGITDLDPPAMAIAEVVLDLVMVVGDVDHDLAHAVARQMLDQVFEHRLAENRHHRFGHVLRERPDPRPLARSQNHRLRHRHLPRAFMRHCVYYRGRPGRGRTPPRAPYEGGRPLDGPPALEAG
jgi:hypothetical protein